MSLSFALILLIILTGLVTTVAVLRQVIRGDGYGLRPPPRSHADDQPLARLPG
jgi:hypothetical protein